MTTLEVKGEKGVVERKQAAVQRKQITIDQAREALAPLRDDPKAIREVLAAIAFSPSARLAIRDELSNGKARLDTSPQVKSSEKAPEDLLAHQVKELREARDWSMRKLASEVGVSQRSVQLVEQAAVSCELNTLCLYGAAFGRSPRGLLFPHLIKRHRPIMPADALATLATTLRKKLRPGEPVHKSVDGIVAQRHYPSLRVLNEIAESIGSSLADLLP